MSPAGRMALVAMAAYAVLAGGCRENEKDRPLDFRPHVYQGAKPTPLTAQQKEQLQERGNLQR